MQKKIIYLDRDGVINEDFGYVSKVENFKFVNGVFISSMLAFLLQDKYPFVPSLVIVG